jgi:hypothetical protein
VVVECVRQLEKIMMGGGTESWLDQPRFMSEAVTAFLVGCGRLATLESIVVSQHQEENR